MTTIGNATTGNPMVDAIDRICHNMLMTSKDLIQKSQRLAFFSEMLVKDFYRNKQYGRHYCVLRCAGMLLNTQVSAHGGGETMTPIAEYDARLWGELLTTLAEIRDLMLRNDANAHHSGMEDPSRNEELANHNLFKDQYDLVVQAFQFQQVVSYILPLIKDGKEIDLEHLSEMLGLIKTNFKENNDYRSCLLSLFESTESGKTVPELKPIDDLKSILKKRRDLTIDRCVKKCQQLIQSWYVFVFPESRNKFSDPASEKGMVEEARIESTGDGDHDEEEEDDDDDFEPPKPPRQSLRKKRKQDKLVESFRRSPRKREQQIEDKPRRSTHRKKDDEDEDVDEDEPTRNVRRSPRNTKKQSEDEDEDVNDIPKDFEKDSEFDPDANADDAEEDDDDDELEPLKLVRRSPRVLRNQRPGSPRKRVKTDRYSPQDFLSQKEAKSEGSKNDDREMEEVNESDEAEFEHGDENEENDNGSGGVGGSEEEGDEGDAGGKAAAQGPSTPNTRQSSGSGALREISSATTSIDNQERPRLRTPRSVGVWRKIPSPDSTPPKPKRGRTRKDWTEEESLCVEEGVGKLGIGYWAEIKKMYKKQLKGRTNIQIKDRWRTIKSKRMKQEGTDQD